MKPEGIPDDIWEAAQFVMGWEHRLMPDNARHLTGEVARALLAERLKERERCAAVAERDVDWTQFARQSRKDYKGEETNAFAAPEDDHLPSPANVFAYTNGIASGRVIAATIRSGK
jgi:hypothetical protein